MPIKFSWKNNNIYYHQEVNELLKFLVPKNVRVLEIGCAAGQTLASVEPSRGVGIDRNSESIEQARKEYAAPHLQFFVAGAEEFNLNEKFDYIILCDAIRFFDDVQQVFFRLQKYCHGSTKIIITHPNYPLELVLKTAEKFFAGMKNPINNWLTRQDVDNLLCLSDFEVVKKGRRLLLTNKIPIFSTFLNRFLARLPLFSSLCLLNFVVARPKPTAQVLKTNPSVSVVIPTRNERGNIEAVVKRLPQMGAHTEIIFVEGNSSDNTWEEIQRVKHAYPALDIKIMQQEGKGKGDAVRKGFDAATGDILMILDADLTVRPEDLPKFYHAIAFGAGEFINGSRLVYRLEARAMRKLNIFANKFFSVMLSWIFNQKLKDTLCGTKVLWRDDYEKIKAGRAFFGDLDPFGDFDLLFGAAKLNLKIIDLPIRYQGRTYGATNISRFRDGWLLLKMCILAVKKIKFT